MTQNMVDVPSAEGLEPGTAGNVVKGRSKVHNRYTGYGPMGIKVAPECRGLSAAELDAGTYRCTDAEVTCSACVEANVLRANAAAYVARLEAEALAAAAAADLAEAQVLAAAAEVVETAPAPAPAPVAARGRLASAAHSARYTAKHAPPIVEADRIVIDTIAGAERASVRLEFPDMADRGRHRRAAAERLAKAFAVEVERQIIIDDDWAGRDPYGPAPWSYGAREITVKGRPSMVARFVVALTPILIDLEYVATLGAKAYGKWLRTGAARYEMMPAEHRQAIRGFRAEVFDEAAYIAGYNPSYSPLFHDGHSWSRQSRAYAHTLPRLGDLWDYADEAAAADLVAAAYHYAPPVLAAEVEAAAAARLEREVRLSETLDLLAYGAPYEFGPMPVDPEYAPPCTDPEALAFHRAELEALEAEVAAEALAATAAEPVELEAEVLEAVPVVDPVAAVLAELAAVVDAAAAHLTPTTHPEGIPYDHTRYQGRRPRRGHHRQHPAAHRAGAGRPRAVAAQRPRHRPADRPRPGARPDRHHARGRGVSAAGLGPPRRRPGRGSATLPLSLVTT